MEVGMYSVLIVDDEAVTRKGLTSHVNWEKYNVTNVNTASSGKDGINFMEQHHVDVVISDVRMPGMNGIEMCNQIKEIAPNCRIIFLSGYSDKEYLKGAIELEAVSYVEKPIDIEEVENALEKAIGKIEESLTIQKTIDDVIEESRELYTQTFLQKLIKGKLSVDGIKDYVDKLNSAILEKTRFNIVIFKANSDENAVSALIDIISECIVGIEYLYFVKEYRYVIFLIAYNDSDSSALKEMYSNMSKALSSHPELKANGSFGNTVSNIMNVKNSYETGVLMLQQLFFLGYGKINHYLKKNDNNSEKINLSDEIFNNLSEALRRYDKETCFNIVNNVKGIVSKKTGVLVSHVKAVYFRITETIINIAWLAKEDETHLSDAEKVSFIMEKLNTLDTLDECDAYVKNLLNEYFSNVQDFINNSKLIIDIIEYIKNNYTNANLCLNDIADSVYITPNYMNSVFKKKFGTTVGQYITMVRINAAKELIMDRSIKLSEVADMVGYNDAGYFTKVFRKNVGMSPKDYRER
jgi:two-component system response regulator YesN